MRLENRTSGVRRHHKQSIAVLDSREPEDWHVLNSRIIRRSGAAVSRMVYASALAAGLAALASVCSATSYLLRILFPDIPFAALMAALTVPGILTGAAAGFAGGNALLRLWYGMDAPCRRAVAARHTLDNAPAVWPPLFTRWLFSGSWLGRPGYNPAVPYLRVFTTERPSTCGEEGRIWDLVHSGLTGRPMESLGNCRELSWVETLPTWTVDMVSPVDGARLRAVLGEQAADGWIRRLWRRAGVRWPRLTEKADDRDLEFTAHLVRWGTGQALVVVLRPALNRKGTPGKRISARAAA